MLGKTVFLWNASNGSISEVVTVDEEDGPVNSVSWASEGLYIAVGLNNSDVQIWDSATGRMVCALEWNKHEQELLSSHGFEENHLILWKYPSMVKMAELSGHTSRVLFMTRSPDGYTEAAAAGDEHCDLGECLGLRMLNLLRNPILSHTLMYPEFADDHANAVLIPCGHWSWQNPVEDYYK